MSKTLAEIRFKTLAIITGGDVGADPSPEDAVTLDGYIISEVAEINADGTTYIDDVNALADELFIPVSMLAANAASDEFGGRYDPAKAQQWRNRIRVIARPTPGYGPQQVEYF